MNIEVNKIYCENNLETMSRMNDNFIDLTITSPPYDNLRDYKGYTFDFENVAKELYRVTKPGGVVVWVVGDATINGSETGTSFKQALYFKECGFNLHDTMFYESEKPPLTHNRYEQKIEFMFVLSKGKPKTFNPILEKTNYPGACIDRPKSFKGSRSQNNAFRSRDEHIGFIKEYKYRGNIWKYKTGGGQTTADSIAFNHPAIFPEQLSKDHIYSWSNENDLVYDPFMGSGTTAKGCIELNRNYIGSEISQEYCNIANKRLEKYIIQNKIDFAPTGK